MVLSLTPPDQQDADTGVLMTVLPRPFAAPLRLKWTAGAVLIAAGVCLAPAGTASANTTPPVAESFTITTPMTVVGFDARTAVAHGFAATPQATVGGDCGTSFVTVSRPGSHEYQVRTGFTVDLPAISYSWAVDTYGNTPRRDTWGGGLFFKRSWAAQGKLQTSARNGNYTSIVTSPDYALLADGDICSSGHPAQNFSVN